MGDCRNCMWNAYIDRNIRYWLLCVHPVTIERGPKWQEGDPAFVSYRTADVPVSEIEQFHDCPTFKERERDLKEEIMDCYQRGTV